MIPYADFEMALARWQARKAGTPMVSEEIPSGAVAAEVPVPNAEPAEQSDQAGQSEQAEQADQAALAEQAAEEVPRPVSSDGSGLITISENDAPTPGPDSI